MGSCHGDPEVYDLRFRGEFYAVGRAAASAIMMRQFYEQVGLPARAVIQSDSSAARGMASRIGCGKIRHLQIRDLWVCEAATFC